MVWFSCDWATPSLAQVADANPFRVASALPWKTVPLPAVFDKFSVAGNARFLVLQFPSLGEIARFDLETGSITQRATIADSQVLMTAGSEAILIYDSRRRVIQRWDLMTLKPRIAQPIDQQGQVLALVMGHGSDDLAVAVLKDEQRTFAKILDAKTLRPFPDDYLTESNPRIHGFSSSLIGSNSINVQASADGTCIVIGQDVLSWNAGKFGVSHRSQLPDGVQSLTPNDSGSRIYSARGWHPRHDLQRMMPNDPTSSGTVLPSLNPGFVVELPLIARFDSEIARVKIADTGMVIGTVDRFDAAFSRPLGFRFFGESAPWLYDRQFCFASGLGVLVQIPLARDRLLLHDVNLDQMLESNVTHPIVVSNRPRPLIRPGEKLVHAIEVKPAVSGLTYRLGRHPEGMEISADGVLSWDVPGDYSSASVMIDFTVSHQSQNARQVFELHCPEGAVRAQKQTRTAEMRTRQEQQREQAAKTEALDAKRAADALRVLDERVAEVRAEDISQRRSEQLPKQSRIWTDQSGNQIEATLDFVFAQQVHLKTKSNRQISLEMSQLSDADQQMIKETKLRSETIASMINAEDALAAKLPIVPMQIIRAGITRMARQRGRMIHAYTAKKDGTPLLSWRVHLLAFIGGDDLYRMFRFDEPWDSPHNSKLIPLMPEFYKTVESVASSGKTTLLAVGGSNGVIHPPAVGWAGPNAGRFGDQSHAEKPSAAAKKFVDGDDGVTKAVILNVPPEQAIEWTRPDDWRSDPDTLARWLQAEADGTLALMDNASIEVIGTKSSREDLKRMFAEEGK